MKTSPRWLFAVLTLVLVVAVASLFLASRHVNEAESAGGSACINQCGNGTCEEMVCMAVGCPCAETVESCPQDCTAKP